MQLKRLVVPSKQALFVRELENQIISGAMQLGERLPTERDMAQQMQISKTIVHEGIAQLAAKGFVEIVPHKGAFVADYARCGMLGTLVSILQYNGGSFDKKTMRSIVQFRKENEGTGAALAAKNRSEDDLARLESLLLRIADSKSAACLVQLVSEFHRDMFCATGNNIYPLVYNAFATVIRDFTEIIFENISGREASAELAKVLQAIRMQDEDAARAEMTRLIDKRAKELEVKYYKTRKAHIE